MDLISAYHWFDLLLLRPSLIVLSLFIALRTCRTRSAATRHWLALCGFCALPLIPLINWFVPNTPIEILPSDWAMQTMPSAHIESSPNQQSSVNWLAVIYLMVAGMLLLKLFIDLFNLKRLRKNLAPVNNADLLNTFTDLCQNMGIDRDVDLKITGQNLPPHAWGLTQPVVVLPQTMLHANGLTAILTHELAHIKRHDWPIAVTGRVICALFWFLPWVWWLWRRMETLAENACDDQVLEHGVPGYCYAEELVKMTRDKDCAFAVAAFKKRAGLYQRIRDLLDDTIAHHQPGNIARGTTLLLCSLVLVPLSALQATTIQFTANLLGAKLYPVETFMLQATRQQQPSSPQSTPRPTLAKVNVPVISAENETPYSGQSSVTLIEDIDAHTAQKPTITLSSIHIEDHHPLHTVTPQYPHTALQKNIEGKVVVEYNIDENGLVNGERIVTAEPEGIFERSALNAVKKFRFHPLSVNGRPIATNGVRCQFLYQLTDTRRAKRRQGAPGSSGPPVNQLARTSH